MTKLGVTVRRTYPRSGHRFIKQVPSAHCSQCDKVVERCRHVTAYFDAEMYAPCDCPTHTQHCDPCNTPCVMVEYLDGKRPGRWVSTGGHQSAWRWPDGRPTVRCMNCGVEWLEPVIGTRIEKAQAVG